MRKVEKLKVLTVLTVVIILLGLVLGTSCGEPGSTGLDLQSIVNNGDGTFTLNLTDGSSFTTDGEKLWVEVAGSG